MQDIEDMPGHLARRFQQIAVAIFHARLAGAGHDLTPVQFAALNAVGACPGIDQATLAGLIAHDRTTITGVVDRLTQKGLLARQISETDRRARVLALTPQGQELMTQVRPLVDEVQRTLLRGLDAEEADEFLRLLRKVIAAANDLSRAPLREMPRMGGGEG